MATVRIYKVAELLGTTSQEVTALLKRDHGIEVKSASSTIEEVVGRQFVERLARQRNIALPGGDMFAETPVVKGKKPSLAKKAAEPVKPPAPALPPPRLVKAIKPVAAAPVIENEAIAESEAVAAEVEATATEAPFDEAVTEAQPEAAVAGVIETATCIASFASQLLWVCCDSCTSGGMPAPWSRRPSTESACWRTDWLSVT